MADGAGDVMCAWLGPAVELAHDDLAVGLMTDNAGFQAVEADEAKAAENLLCRKQLREGFFISETVLQSEHGGVGANQRGQELGELVVGGGLEANEHDICHTDLFRGAGAFGIHMEVAFRTEDAHAFAADDVVVRAQEEMHFMAITEQFGSVIAAEGTASYDRELHGIPVSQKCINFKFKAPSSWETSNLYGQRKAFNEHTIMM